VEVETEAGGCHLPVPRTNAASTSRIMPVWIRVAKSESMFCNPALAKIAVKAANTADSSAQNNHCELASMVRLSCRGNPRISRGEKGRTAARRAAFTVL
jgi:hypothetical protein